MSTLDAYLFCQLPLVDVDFLGCLLQGVLEKHDVLLVFLALDNDFLQLALLLAQDLDGFGVPPLLLIQFQFHILDAGFQFADDALATDDGVGLDLFEADRDILKEKSIQLIIHWISYQLRETFYDTIKRKCMIKGMENAWI